MKRIGSRSLLAPPKPPAEDKLEHSIPSALAKETERQSAVAQCTYFYPMGLKFGTTTSYHVTTFLMEVGAIPVLQLQAREKARRVYRTHWSQLVAASNKAPPMARAHSPEGTDGSAAVDGNMAQRHADADAAEREAEEIKRQHREIFAALLAGCTRAMFNAPKPVRGKARAGRAKPHVEDLTEFGLTMHCIVHPMRAMAVTDTQKASVEFALPADMIGVKEALAKGKGVKLVRRQLAEEDRPFTPASHVETDGDDEVLEAMMSAEVTKTKGRYKLVCPIGNAMMPEKDLVAAIQQYMAGRMSVLGSGGAALGAMPAEPHPLLPQAAMDDFRLKEKLRASFGLQSDRDVAASQRRRTSISSDESSRAAAHRRRSIKPTEMTFNLEGSMTPQERSLSLMSPGGDALFSPPAAAASALQQRFGDQSPTLPTFSPNHMPMEAITPNNDNSSFGGTFPKQIGSRGSAMNTTFGSTFGTLTNTQGQSAIRAAAEARRAVDGSTSVQLPNLLASRGQQRTPASPMGLSGSNLGNTLPRRHQLPALGSPAAARGIGVVGGGSTTPALTSPGHSSVSPSTALPLSPGGAALDPKAELRRRLEHLAETSKKRPPTKAAPMKATIGDVALGRMKAPSPFVGGKALGRGLSPAPKMASGALAAGTRLHPKV